MTTVEELARAHHADWYRAVYNRTADQAEIDRDWTAPLDGCDLTAHRARHRRKAAAELGVGTEPAA